MFAQNVMLHFILTVLKIILNLGKEDWMNVIDNAFLMSFAPVSSKEFLDIQATIECRFTLKRVRDMIRTYSHQFVALIDMYLQGKKQLYNSNSFWDINA